MSVQYRKAGLLLVTLVWAASVDADAQVQGGQREQLPTVLQAGQPMIGAELSALADLCIDQELLSDAEWMLTTFQSTAATSREHTLVRLRLATAAIDQGQLSMAERLLSTLSGLNPELAIEQQRQMLRLRARQGNAHGAAEAVKALLGLQPDNQHMHYNLAVYLGRSGQTEEAIRRLSVPLKSATNANLRELAAISLAELQLRQGELDAASAALVHITDNSIYHAMALKLQGQVLQRKGQHAAARQLWQRLIAQHPDEAGAYWLHTAGVQEKLGDSMDALATYRRAVMTLARQQALLGELLTLDQPNEILTRLSAAPELLDMIFRDEDFLSLWRKYRVTTPVALDKQKVAQTVAELQARITDAEQAAMLQRVSEKLSANQTLANQQRVVQEKLLASLRVMLETHATQLRQLAERAEFELVRLQDDNRQRSDQADLPSEAGSMDIPALISAYSRLGQTLQDQTLRQLALQRQQLLELEHGHVTQERLASIEQQAKTLPSDASSAVLLYQLARRQLAAGKQAKALATLVQLTEDYPRSPLWREAQFRRAELQFSQRAYAAAALSYGQLIAGKATQPYYKEALYKLGWSHLKMGSLGTMQESFYDLLDVLALGDDIEALPTTDQAMARDALRALAITYMDTKGVGAIGSYWDARKKLPPYQSLIYQTLAEKYLEQQRYSEAGDTFATLAKQLPQHPRTVHTLMRAAEAYEHAGLSNQAQAIRTALLKQHELPGRAVLSQTGATTTGINEELAQAQLQSAKYYHGQAQQTGKRELFSQAVLAYQRFIQQFPQSAMQGEAQFLEGEVQTELGNYPAAVTAYYRAAYELAKHPHSAEAGYAELLTWQKRQDLEAGARQNGFEASMARFIKAFPEDDRWPNVMQKKAEDLFAAGDKRLALVTAQQIQQTLQSLAKPVSASVMALIARCEYELGQYEAAEQAMKQGLAAQSGGAGQGTQLAQLATAIFRQGELAYQRQNWAEAAGHFARVPADAGDYLLAQYYGGVAYHQQRDYVRAAQMLNVFVSEATANEFTNDARIRLVESYESLGQWAAAASQLEILAPTANKEAQHRAWLAQAAQNYTKAGRDKEAAQVYERIIIWFNKPLEMIMDTRLKLAAWYQSQGDLRRQRAQLEEIAKKRPYTKGNAELAAQVGKAALMLAEMDDKACQALRLTHPLEETVKRKKVLLQSAIYYYNLAQEQDGASYASRTTYQKGALYQGFAQALLDSERPSDLTGEEQEVYTVMLEEQAFPFEEKAIELFSAHLSQPSGNVADPWLEKSRQALKTLRPAQPVQ